MHELLYLQKWRQGTNTTTTTSTGTAEQQKPNYEKNSKIHRNRNYVTDGSPDSTIKIYMAFSHPHSLTLSFPTFVSSGKGHSKANVTKRSLKVTKRLLNFNFCLELTWKFVSTHQHHHHPPTHQQVSFHSFQWVGEVKFTFFYFL